MPLVKSVSKKAVQQNTEELIASGRPANQAYAIANGVKRKARKLKKPSGTGGYMDFEEALSHMKSGGVVSRSGWNGKGLTAYITDLEIDEHHTSLFVLKSSAGYNQWVPSASDLLAEDWILH